MGALDVPMNAQGAALELRSGRPIMSSFQAAFSLGGMAGAATGGLAAAAGAGPAAHLAVVAALLTTAGLLTTRWLLPASADAVAGGTGIAWLNRSLAGLGTAALCVLLAGGAIADWSGPYLHETVGTGPGLATSGYAAFSLAMAAGRLASHRPRSWIRSPARLAGPDSRAVRARRADGPYGRPGCATIRRLAGCRRALSG